MFNHCPPKILPDLDSVTNENGTRFYVTPTGIRLPSVTTVVGAQSKQAIMEWRNRVGEEEANKVTKKATGRGTKLHTLCEDYLQNKPLTQFMPDIKELFVSVKPYLNRIDNIHYIEQSFWSEKVGMAGRADCIAEFDGELSVIDHKTSGKLKTKDQIISYFWQTAAYALMYEELVGTPINKLVIIMAVEGDKPLLFVENTKDHIDGLVKAIKYYKTNS